MHPRKHTRLLSQPTISGRSLLLALTISIGAWGENNRPSAPGPDTSAAAPRTFEPNSQAVTLQTLLAFAEQHSPLLRTANSRVGLAEAEVIAASPLLPQNPTFSGNVGTRSNDDGGGMQFQLGFSQAVEVAGERGLRRKVAQAGTKVASSSREEVRWTVHVEVHRLHNELLLLEQRQTQAERFVTFSLSLQKIARSQVAAGETAPLTLLVADADVAETQSSLLEVQQQVTATRQALRTVIGWPSSDPLVIKGTLPSTTKAPETHRLLQLMVQNHPSLQTRREAVMASRAQLSSQRRSGWPKPTFGGSYTREPGLSGEPNTHIWLFDLSVPLPLWQRNQGGVALANAELDVALSLQTEIEIRLKNDLLTTAQALDSAAAQVRLYENSVIPQLEKNLLALQRAYELGEVDLLQVSQTRQRLLEASRRYLDARISYFRAAAALEGYVGSEIVPHSTDTP